MSERDLGVMLTPDILIEQMASKGGNSYFGEPVTVLEHCLQAAHFAEVAGSSDALVVAALLHDIGHLLHDSGEDAADHGLDMRHEELGNQLLAAYLPTEVTQPVLLHVAAKRYLCYAEPDYLGQLSSSSVLSLQLQGGPMTQVEADEFMAQPCAKEAVTLRHWDDEAKIPGLVVPGLESYRERLVSLWK